MQEGNKLSILKQLSKNPSEAAKATLEKEAKKIEQRLVSSTDFEILTNDLQAMQVIAFRLSEWAVFTCKEFLKRVKTLELTYDDSNAYFAQRGKTQSNNFYLIHDALKVMDHLRYSQIERVIPVVKDYLDFEFDVVAKQSLATLEALAKYDIDIYYGSQTWEGLGAYPQQKLLEAISEWEVTEQKRYTKAICKLCTEMLSAEMRGTRWTYESVHISTGLVPAAPDVIEVRGKAINLLIKLYGLSTTVGEKNSVISGLQSATRKANGKADGELTEVIVSNTIAVLGFFKLVIPSADLQIVQAIEHDVYFVFRRYLDERVTALCLSIKNILDAYEEYKIFKALIGFQGIFGEWSHKDNGAFDIQASTQIREELVDKYALSVNADSAEKWLERILSYSKIQSNDLATFPSFGEFLQKVAIANPTFALILLSKHTAELERFLIPILLGLSETEVQNQVGDYLQDWAVDKRFAPIVARFLSFRQPLDNTLLSQVANTGLLNEDIYTMSQTLSAIAANAENISHELLKNLFIPIIQKLADLDSYVWIYDVWFRPHKDRIFSLLTTEEHKIVLANLLKVPKISYEMEGLLTTIAKYSAPAVVDWFCERINVERSKTITEYDAIPYGFHSLREQLATIPHEVVTSTYQTFDESYGWFMLRGARLIHNIFPIITNELELELDKVLSIDTEKSMLFVMGILRAYDGDTNIHSLCKKIVILLPDDSEYRTEIMVALESTGVVHGEYGFADALKERKVEIENWLSDPHPKVREFAEKYLSMLDKQIEAEIQRATERIALNKHQYGED